MNGVRSCRGSALRVIRLAAAALALRGAGAESVVTPNEFTGSDSERINRAVAVAAASGGRVVIPRVNRGSTPPREVWLLDAAILLHGGTRLELDNCRIKLSDRCRDNFMRSANCGMGVADIRPLRNIHIRGLGGAVLEGADHPRATGDSAKTLGRQTYGTDAGVAGESQKGDWRNIGVLLAYVGDFSIEGLAIRESHGWAVSLERCARGVVRDLRFASGQTRVIDGARQTILNQDGVDVRMGCHEILIENITGHTGDDLVALTAIPLPGSVAGATASTMVSGSANRGPELDEIRDVVVRNVQGYCQGGHHIVRLLNTPGSRMHDVLVDGVTDISPPGVRCKATVKIGDRNYGGGMAPLGDTTRIAVRNIESRARHAVLISGSLADSTISNVLHRGTAPEAVTVESGPQNTRGVEIIDARRMPE